MLWFLAAAAVPVVIHLIYGFRRKKIPTGAIWMIRQVLERNARRLRLRDILLLLMRIAAVALVVLAFARPLGRGLTAAGGDFLIVLDDSCMAGSRTGPDLTAFETLRTRLLDALPGRGRFHLLTASGRFEGDYEDVMGLTVALRGMRPSWSGWRPDAVLRRSPAGRPFTGVFIAAVNPFISQGEAMGIELHTLSPPEIIEPPIVTGNVTLHGAEPVARRPGTGVLEVGSEAIALSCFSTFEQPVRGILALKSDGRVRVSKPVKVRPGESGLIIEPPDVFGPWYIAQAELDVTDSLPEDNVFHLVMQVRPVPEVMVVSREHRRPVFLSPDYYVLRALEAGGRFRTSRSTADAFASPSGPMVVVLAGPDLIPKERLDKLLSGGTAVAVFLAGDLSLFEGLEPGRRDGEGEAVEVPAESPLEGFSPEALAAPDWGAGALDPGPEWHVWARVRGVPVVLSHRELPLVVVNSYAGRKNADLVRHRVFVPLMHRIIEHLEGTGVGRLSMRLARVGHVLRPPVRAEVTGPRGARFELKEGDELRLEEPGVYRIHTVSGEGREKLEYTGVNLDVPLVSSIGMVPVSEVFRVDPDAAEVGRGQVDESGRTGPWRYIVLGLLALLVVEMILGALPLIRGR